MPDSPFYSISGKIFLSGMRKGRARMGGNYEKSIYNQLMEVMARLDTIENELCTEKQEHRDDVDR